MQSKKLISALLGLSLIVNASLTPLRAEFSDAQVLAGSVNVSCLDYCIIGICIWLICTPVGCTTDTSPRISHRLPDIVLSAYPEPGEIAWLDARSIIGSAAKAAAEEILADLTGIPLIGGGHNKSLQKTGKARDDNHRSHRSYNNYEIAATGNPFAKAVSGSWNEYLCDTKATPWFPYFQSEYDAFTWRFGTPEMIYPQTWIPLTREIGSTFSTNLWGTVYPRIGSVVQMNPPRAAAVMGQRAIDVITQWWQPHVYLPLQNEHVSEDDSTFNMISPNLDATCSAFGDSRYEWDTYPDDDQYGWLFWNPYECCIPRPGMLIGVIPTPELCLI